MRTVAAFLPTGLVKDLFTNELVSQEFRQPYVQVTACFGLDAARGCSAFYSGPESHRPQSYNSNIIQTVDAVTYYTKAVRPETN
jgi:hypothetical protein